MIRFQHYFYDRGAEYYSLGQFHGIKSSARGLSYKEIATVIDVPIGTVMSRLAGSDGLAAYSRRLAAHRRSKKMTAETSGILLHAYLDGELDAASATESWKRA